MGNTTDVRVALRPPVANPHYTDHVRERWAERFPEFSLEREFGRARLAVTKQMEEEIKYACYKHIDAFSAPIFSGQYLRRTPENIVFIIKQGNVVVTVLDCTDFEVNEATAVFNEKALHVVGPRLEEK